MAISTALLISATYIKYTDLLKETHIQQANSTQSYQHRLHILFSQYETIHRLVGEQYQKNTFNPLQLNIVMAQKPLLYSMAIYSLKGELLESTQPFFHKGITDKHFLNASQQSKLVIGEVYFDQSINKWLTPLYHGIEEDNGHISAVSVSLLDTMILNQQWQETTDINNKRFKSSNKNVIQVTLLNGLMPILNPSLKPQQYHQYYSEMLDSAMLATSTLHSSGHKEHYTSPTSQVKKETPPLNTPQLKCAQSDVDNTANISTFIFDNHYQLCISAEIPAATIKARLLFPFIIYSLLYLLLISITFVLVKWIIRLNASKIDALTYEAEHDALTGLANGQTLKKYYLEAKEKNAAFSLLYLDLDKFKSINDSFGHSCGDKILVQVAERIKRSIELYNGTAIRYSGDEFVLLVNSDDKELLQHCATHLLDTVSQPYVIGQNAFRVSSSIGIACYPEDANDIETLLSYADNSMYVAKQTNAPCLFFSKSTHQQLTQRVEIEQALHHAIERQEINMVYQPQVNADNTLCGVEALVRWDSDDLGFIGPDTFIPIAEECGMMPKIGLYIIHKAMEEITQLQQEIGQNFTLSINVSVRQFIKLDFIDTFLHALTKYTKINPNLTVSIEITESLFIESVESLLPLFHKLKHHHVILSLDDFGTGYSSLSLLRDLPIDELKIDKSFVDYITTNSTDKAMVESIIGMGKKIGLSVLAEGVEDRQQADILLAAGCDLFQGYFFSKPLSIEELKKYCIQQPSVAALVSRNALF